jgi:GNAT superfamily N-acetyltransferase
MPIRDAHQDDIEQISALIRELAEFERAPDEVRVTTEDLHEHLFGPHPAAAVLIAEPADERGTVAGMALWFRTFSTWEGRPGIWLEDLYVRPAWRGRGLGGELLAELRQRSRGRIEWMVLDWNREAIEFYRRLGARPVDGWTRYRWAPHERREHGGRQGRE